MLLSSTILFQRTCKASLALYHKASIPFWYCFAWQYLCSSSTRLTTLSFSRQIDVRTLYVITVLHNGRVPRLLLHTFSAFENFLVSKLVCIKFQDSICSCYGNCNCSSAVLVWFSTRAVQRLCVARLRSYVLSAGSYPDLSSRISGSVLQDEQFFWQPMFSNFRAISRGGLCTQRLR